MWLQFIIFLSFFCLTLGNNLKDLFNTTDSEVIVSYIYDDTEIKQIKSNLSLLQDINKDLIHKIDLQEKNLNQMKMFLQLNMQQMNTLINTGFNKLYEELRLQQQETSKFFKECEAVLLPSNCTEALKNNGKSGIYQIRIQDSNLNPFNAYCLRNGTNEINKDDNAAEPYTDWMLIQRRLDGSVDFFRNWTAYKEGFGDLNGEFFIGLDKLHDLTKSGLHELWIQLEDFEGEKYWAKYSNFSIGNEAEAYELKSLGTYRGNAGDGLSYHIDQKWTTRDVDNDQADKGNCANIFKGAWWYNQCHESNLNGLYLRGAYNIEMRGKGITWVPCLGNLYSPKYVHMAIRPIYVNNNI